MVTPATQREETVREGRRVSSRDPRRFSPVQPRPMVEVYKGWWNVRPTRRETADLVQEDRKGPENQDLANCRLPRFREFRLRPCKRPSRRCCLDGLKEGRELARRGIFALQVAPRRYQDAASLGAVGMALNPAFSSLCKCPVANMLVAVVIGP